MKDILDKIDVLYESKRYVAINKPAGLIVHGDGRSDEKTLVDWFIENYPDSKDIGEPITIPTTNHQPPATSNRLPATSYQLPVTSIRSGIAHRLDRETSGVLILAKTEEAYKYLKRQFKDRKVQKTYVAYVHGVPKTARGIIDKPIGKSRVDFRQWSASREARGKMREAKTVYKVLDSGNGYALLELFPKTGRTHQIRVHLKSINHPVVGDSLYAVEIDRPQGDGLGFERLALHAKSLSFKDPYEGEIFIEAPIPQDFEKAFRKMKAQAPNTRL